MYKINEFANKTELDNTFAEQVANTLSDAIASKGHASLAVSGGGTPKGFFQALSQKNIDWSKVTVTLADERWVDFSSDASNTRLVKENLLKNLASDAKFFDLKREGELSEQTIALVSAEAQGNVLPFDVAILGMGEDGHTASLFPCSDQIVAGFSDECANVLKVEPKTAPNERISFSYNALVHSENLYLHIAGQSKKAVLTDALSSEDKFEMPIRGFLHHPSKEIVVMWAE